MYNTKHRYLPFVAWLFPVLFFAYQFILRLWPGLTMSNIMSQLSIDASHFGLLAAFYYYGYAGFQIPVALLLDRLKVRTVLLGFATLCGLATLIFTYTENFYLALLSRFLVGVGSAVGFLGVSKVVSELFPREQYARMVGLSFTVGLMGAIYGGKPISILIEHYDWRSVALWLSVASIALGLAAFCALRILTPSYTTKHVEDKVRLKDLYNILKTPSIWLLALANFLMVGTLEGFADVWGISYLMHAYHMTKSDAAMLISCVFFGMLFGGPLLAFTARYLGNYPTIALSGIGMAALLASILLQVTEQWIALASMIFMAGVLCCYQVIVFDTGIKLVSHKCLGVVVAFLNCINMLGGSFFHTCIGWLMDLSWSGNTSATGIREYDLQSYTYALSIIPSAAMVGVVLICVLAVVLSRKKGRAALSFTYRV